MDAVSQTFDIEVLGPDFFPFFRAVFSPDSQYLTVGGANGNTYIWNVDDPSRTETVLKEHSAPVVAAAWQPAGNSLTTCDKNKNVVVWAAI